MIFEGMHHYHLKFTEGPFLLQFCLNFGSQSITFEGIDHLHSEFTEGQSIVKSGKVRILRSLGQF